MTDASMGGRALTLLDAVCAVMDRPLRPLDFTVILDVPSSVTLDGIRRGATSARRCYPVSGARLTRGCWQPGSEPPDSGVRSAAAASRVDVLRDFVDGPFDLRTETPVRQIWIGGGATRPVLASRFHHAAVDGTSASAWLGHALEVACGERRPIERAGAWSAPLLRGVRRDADRLTTHQRSAPIWRRAGGQTRRRRWQTIELERPDRTERFGGRFTYSDLLATVAVEVLTGWNRVHGAKEGAAVVGLWIPITVRAAGDTAFGNATSRVRVHAAYRSEAPFEVNCACLRQALAAAIESAEWHVPASHPAGRLPWAMKAGLLRAYLQRPWADLGSVSFSHIDRWTTGPGAVFDHAATIECVSSLHAGQPLAITGVTRGRRTWLTFTHDPGLLTDEDVTTLIRSYSRSYAAVRRALACAA